MSILKGLQRTLHKTAGATLDLQSPTGWLIGEEDNLPVTRAMKVSAVNRCVELRSNTMAALPVYLMDERSKQRLSDHRLGAVLWGRANEAMTSFDYEKLMQANRDLHGNAYAWISRDLATGYPRELLPLLPDCVTPWLDALGHLWYVFVDPKRGSVTHLPPADVLHYKAFSTNGLVGISILSRAAQIVGSSLSAQQYEKAVYDNGGRPSGVLTTEADLGGEKTITTADGKKITISRKDFLRREWDKVHSGAGNAFRLAVLDFGLKYQPIALSQSDAQFVESADLRVSDICRFFGVPPHLAFAGKQSYSSNEQNSLEYVKYTLQPDVTQREQEDSYKLLLLSERAAHLRIKREMKVYLRGDTAAQAAWYKAMRECSVYSADDIRALEDLESVPGGGSRYASWNYGPLEQWEELSTLRAMGGKAKEE